jgi:hypothetical protein
MFNLAHLLTGNADNPPDKGPAILSSAQSAADNGDYQGAINTASGISTSSSVYGNAQNRIEQWRVALDQQNQQANGSCPDIFSPNSFNGTTGKVAFYNEWSEPVTVVLYHPSNSSLFNRYTVDPGTNLILGGDVIVGDDWGVCFEKIPNSAGSVNNLGLIAEYNPNWDGSPLFMIQNPRIIP